MHHSPALYDWRRWNYRKAKLPREAFQRSLLAKGPRGSVLWAFLSLIAHIFFVLIPFSQQSQCFCCDLCELSVSRNLFGCREKAGKLKKLELFYSLGFFCLEAEKMQSWSRLDSIQLIGLAEVSFFFFLSLGKPKQHNSWDLECSFLSNQTECWFASVIAWFRRKVS